jgi:hypothetical protein
MQKFEKAILLASTLILSIAFTSPITAHALMPEFVTFQILGTFSGAEVPGPEVKSVFVDKDIPIDPTDSMWQNVQGVEISVMGQNITIPILFNPTVSSINVQSINNGTWIGWRLEWKDPSKSDSALATDNFRDAVAISLPTTTGRTFVAMGGPGTPVNILHWKADWQADVDLGRYLDRQDAYPNMAYDLYVGAKNGTEGYNAFQGVVGGYHDSNEVRVPVEQVNKMYLPGYAAGNSFSQRDAPRQTPIEELVAEGFGTLTSQKTQGSYGKGVWNNGVWQVTIVRPMLTGDMSDAQLQPGEKTNIAFAVWDGGNREVDGRKSVALWHTLMIEQGATSALVEKQPLAVLGPEGGEKDYTGVIAASIAGVAAVVAAVIFYAARRRAPVAKSQ